MVNIKMSRNSGRSKNATIHTGVIGTPRTMWEKLAWNVDVFQDTQRRMPNEDQPLAYAAIDVCIAAASLGDWACVYWVRSGRAAGFTRNETSFRSLLSDRIETQAMCDAIANTSKHSEVREGQWADGAVKLLWEDGNEDWPSGYQLYFEQNGTKASAYSLFDRTVMDWWNFLCELELAEGDQPAPAWLHNKLVRIFGDLAKKLPRP